MYHKDSSYDILKVRGNLISMLLYQIVHLESGNKYVGQTSRPAIKRWREHLYPLRKGKHHNRFLQAAWNKYGESAFKFETIKEFNSLEELNQAEIDLIKTGSNLFNLADGGNGYKHLNASKKKIGESNKRPVVGMNIKTREMKEYASATDSESDGFNATRIRKCARKSISKRKDGTTFASISHKGWVWMSKESATKEALMAKCDIALLGKTHNERSVIGMNIFTKEIVRFKSASEASRNGFNLTNVHRACNVFSAIHKGFVWIYGDLPDSESLLQDKVGSALSQVKRGPKSWV